MKRLHQLLTKHCAVIAAIIAFILPLATSAQSASPLCFTARNGSVTVHFDKKNATHTIQYSTNGTSWSTYTSNANVTINAGQSIYFRAASNQTTASAFGAFELTSSSHFYFSSTNGGKVEASGNIMSLYGPSCPNLPLQSYAFAHIFDDDSLLTTPPELPATTLAYCCYFEMFKKCTYLTRTPLLPATILADGCYDSMFARCFRLTTVCALNSTSLAELCYSNMFSYCRSLTSFPALPATTLYEGCYWCMFAHCTSLTTLPELPATTLTAVCYYRMFAGCTSLVINTSGQGQRWQIQATSTTSNSLDNMFTETSGTMHGTPIINCTYYIASAPKYNVTGITDDSTKGYVNGSGLYYRNEFATLTATPAQHNHFVAWSDGNTLNPRIVTVYCDSTLTAIFETDKHTISLNDSNGIVTGIGVYDYNTTATLTAVPNSHYHFVSWPDGDTARTKSFTVTQDTTFTSLFEIDKHSVTATCEHGTVSGTGTYDYGSNVTLTAVSDENYHFVVWSDNNHNNPRNVLLTSDTSFTAIFDDKYIVSVSDTNGTVSGLGKYYPGDTATLTATANEYYHVCWPDGDTSRTKSFIVTGDITFESLFARNIYSISATCEHGTINGCGEYEYEDIVTLSVIVDKGYRFVQWNDGNEYNPRIEVVTSNMTLEAICEKAPEETSLENTTTIPSFYIQNNIIYNPDNIPLRLYSPAGQLLQQSTTDITLEIYPDGIYIIADDNGTAIKTIKQ